MDGFDPDVFRVYWSWAADPSGELCWRESRDPVSVGLVAGAVERHATNPLPGHDGPFIVEGAISPEAWALFQAGRDMALELGAADLGLLMPVEG